MPLEAMTPPLSLEMKTGEGTGNACAPGARRATKTAALREAAAPAVGCASQQVVQRGVTAEEIIDRGEDVGGGAAAPLPMRGKGGTQGRAPPVCPVSKLTAVQATSFQKKHTGVNQLLGEMTTCNYTYRLGLGSCCNLSPPCDQGTSIVTGPDAVSRPTISSKLPNWAQISAECRSSSEHYRTVYAKQL